MVGESIDLVEGVDRPGRRVDRPGRLVDRPGRGVDRPGRLVDRPGLGVDRPGRLVDRPGRLVDRPGRLVDRPGRLVDRPGRLVDRPGRLVDRLTHVWTSCTFFAIDILKGTQRAPRPALAQAPDAGRGTLCVISFVVYPGYWLWLCQLLRHENVKRL